MTPVDRIKMPPGFWTGLQKLGSAPQDLARAAKLPLTVITEPNVTTADYFAIWQAYAECYGNAA